MVALYDRQLLIDKLHVRISVMRRYKYHGGPWYKYVVLYNWRIAKNSCPDWLGLICVDRWQHGLIKESVVIRSNKPLGFLQKKAFHTPSIELIFYCDQILINSWVKSLTTHYDQFGWNSLVFKFFSAVFKPLFINTLDSFSILIGWEDITWRCLNGWYNHSQKCLNIGMTCELAPVLIRQVFHAYWSKATTGFVARIHGTITIFHFCLNFWTKKFWCFFDRKGI